jgi:hypothetical protein
MARWQQYVMDRMLRAALPALLQVGGARLQARHVSCSAVVRRGGAVTRLLASACVIACDASSSA